jgi:hypothetical protein
VVFDSLGSLLAEGLDENDNAAMTAALSSLRTLADEYGFCALLVHHFRKEQQFSSRRTLARVRGAGALTAVADTVLGVRHGRDGTIVIEPAKTRWTAQPQSFWVRISGGEKGGVEILYDGSPEPRKSQSDLAEEFVMGCFLDTNALLRKELERRAQSAGVSKRTLTDCLTDLHGRGLLKKRHVGREVEYHLPEPE